MLIRGQTTEDRIAQIAERFGQGLQNFNQGQDRQRAISAQEDAKSRQLEAEKRQRALEAFNTASSMSEKTGKIVTPDMVAPMLGSGDFSGLGDILKSAPTTPKYEAEQKKIQQQDRLIESQINKNNRVTGAKENLTYEQKLQKKAEFDAAAKQRPEAKLESLGAEGRSKVGAIASGFQAIDQMVKASKDGHGPQYIDSNTSLVGRFVSDNPYSESERLVAEVVGRLQSGGAMSVDEVNTFKALGPRPGDDGPTRDRKLGQQRDFLQNKLTAFGLSGDELNKLGFQTESKYQPRSQQAPAKVTQQHVNAIKQMSDEGLLRFVQGG